MFGVLHHPVVIKVQAGDTVVALGVAGLLLHGDHLAVLVELHDAEPLRVADIVAEDGGGALIRLFYGVLEHLAHAGAVEDVVPQNHGAGVVADEFLPQQKGLGQSVRGGLDLVGQLEPVLAAVP